MVKNYSVVHNTIQAITLASSKVSLLFFSEFCCSITFEIIYFEA